MKISIGCDHAGPGLKEKIKELLSSRGHECIDMGTNGPGSVDYPDHGRAVASSVSKKETERGILICGTGIGMSIVANKFPDVRATLCYDLFTARMSRQHNDSNILVLGSRTTEEQLALSILEAWLDTDFEGGRHQDRLNKIGEMERVICNG